MTVLHDRVKKQAGLTAWDTVSTIPRAMGRYITIPWRVLLLIGLLPLFATVSCDPAPAKPTTQQTKRIASLVPAATEMLIGMGFTDRLVAVSNYESAPQVNDLPRVGDYQSTDWETIARVKPHVMIVQIHPDRVPAGLTSRAGEMGVELINVRIETLDDTINVMRQLATIAGDPVRGVIAADGLWARLDAIKKQSAYRPPHTVLLVRDTDGKELIGPDTFLNDLLPYLNATNAASELKTRYPSVDPERLAALNPQSVIVLLPNARPDAIDQARRFWNNMPQLQAVKNNRIYILSEGYVHVPGPRLADLAQKMSDCLNPQQTISNQQSATRP